MAKKDAISIFGLGYVGSVTAACLADNGFRVIGVDKNATKVRLINKGKGPVIEKGLDTLIKKTVKSGMLMGTVDFKKAVRESDVSFVCVGTPCMENGSLDTSHLIDVCREIGRAIRKKSRRHLIVVRSTVLPGTTEGVLVPQLETASSRRAFRDFGVGVNPEFMREGNSIEDFYNSAKIIIGSVDKGDANRIRSIYGFLDIPVIFTDIKTAEFSKYLDNTFHALKITYANEIKAICEKTGVDPENAMKILCMDSKSNISPRYLKPGFAFGGSCLPKDLKAIIHKARSLDVSLPLLESILHSNKVCIDRVANKILRSGKKRVGLLGLSFKPGTDDLRESQLVRLAEFLIGKGFNLKIYDRNVSLARLIGSNKEYIKREIPHISSLLQGSLRGVIKNSDVIVVGHSTKEFEDAIKRYAKGKILIDLREK